jgi:hypothetical protein
MMGHDHCLPSNTRAPPSRARGHTRKQAMNRVLTFISLNPLVQ